MRRRKRLPEKVQDVWGPYAAAQRRQAARLLLGGPGLFHCRQDLRQAWHGFPCPGSCASSSLCTQSHSASTAHGLGHQPLHEPLTGTTPHLQQRSRAWGTTSPGESRGTRAVTAGGCAHRRLGDRGCRERLAVLRTHAPAPRGLLLDTAGDQALQSPCSPGLRAAWAGGDFVPRATPRCAHGAGRALNAFGLGLGVGDAHGPFCISAPSRGPAVQRAGSPGRRRRGECYRLWGARPPPC